MKKLLISFAFFASFVLPVSRSAAQVGGLIQTVAGGGSSTANGVIATTAQLTTTSGIALDLNGNIYVADQGTCVVRKIEQLTGRIYTVAGNGTCGFAGDGGDAVSAQLSGVKGIHVDKAGNLYIADDGNDRIRKVDALTGIITTIAGGGTSHAEGAPAITAKLDPQCVFVDPYGSVYTGDDSNRLRKIDQSTGLIYTVAGTGVYGDGGDGGHAMSAAIKGSPKCITMDALDNIYFVPFFGDRVRKIDGGTGIITTVAGGGTSGADGVPATNESLADFHSCSVDGAGNLFIADWNRSTVRWVNANTGIINTIAGVASGGGSLLDGVPAMTAYVHAYMCYADPTTSHIYFTNMGNKVKRFYFSPIVPFPHAGTTVRSDSFSFYVHKLCSGPQLTSRTEIYHPGMTVTSYFGDGTMETHPIVPSYLGRSGHSVITHSYANSGTYSIKQVLFMGTDAVDSMRYSFQYTLCNDVKLNLYMDDNLNCMKDTLENNHYLALKVVVDSNNIPVDTLIGTSSIYYSEYGVAGDVYKYRVLTASTWLTPYCPLVGYITDTIKPSIFNRKKYDFGLACSTHSVFDLGVQSVVAADTRRHNSDILLQNKYCIAVPATLTMEISPRYRFSSSIPAPTSVSGRIVTWDFTGLTGNNSAPDYVSVRCYALSGLVNGDTVHTRFGISPITGDYVPTDNTEIRIDTVRGSHDPNYIEVSPSGMVLAGTKLEYGIHFENTGNDTAFNIYVLDTLSDYLDVNSMELLGATAKMDFTLIKTGGYKIAKFDFPDINLLDSSHDECTGAFMYSINTKAGLPNGTIIPNRVGIYFDYNPVVLTNTAITVIGEPVKVPNRVALPQPHIYPNPASTTLNIDAPNNAYSSFAIANAIGQQLMSGALTATATKLDIAQLAPGVYTITLRGESGVRVEKWTKW